MIKERLRASRKAAGLTQAELGDKIGIGKSSISEWETGKRSPNIDVLWDLSIALSTTTEYLMGWTDDPIAPPPRYTIEFKDKALGWSKPLVDAYATATKPRQEAVCTVLDIPHVDPYGDNDDPQVNIVQFGTPEPTNTVDKIVYTYPSAAGIPLFAEDDFEHIEFPVDQVPNGADFGIRIQGDSMEPTIKDGTIVWVRKATELFDGQIGIFMVDDSAVCKRFYKEGEGIRLESDNDAYDPIVIHDYERFGIVGRVLEYR